MPSPTNVQLGEAIRHERSARGISIEDLAAGAGISWVYLSEVERGKRNPSWGVVGALADELGLEIEDLTRVARGMPA